MDAEFLRRYLGSWNRHAIDELLGNFTDDATYVDVALGQTHAGKVAMRAFFASLEAEFSSDYQFDPGLMVITDTGYAAEWVMRGTHDRTSAMLPATGKSFAIHGASIGELRNGKIGRNTDYWNMTEFLMQVGLMPAASGAPTTGS
jgi:steroid delta-isomerase-like uncharacterized protein